MASISVQEEVVKFLKQVEEAADDASEEMVMLQAISQALQARAQQLTEQEAEARLETRAKKRGLTSADLKQEFATVAGVALDKVTAQQILASTFKSDSKSKE